MPIKIRQHVRVADLSRICLCLIGFFWSYFAVRFEWFPFEMRNCFSRLSPTKKSCLTSAPIWPFKSSSAIIFWSWCHKGRFDGGNQICKEHIQAKELFKSNRNNSFGFLVPVVVEPLGDGGTSFYWWDAYLSSSSTLNIFSLA